VVSVLLRYPDDDVPFAAGRINDRREVALGSESVLDLVPSDLQALLNRLDVVVAVVGRYWEADPEPLTQARDPRNTLQLAAFISVWWASPPILRGRGFAGSGPASR